MSGFNARTGGLRKWALLCCLSVQVQAFGGDPESFQAWQPHEAWRIGEGTVAPWAEPGTVPLINPELAGQVVRFEGNLLVAPHPLGCTDAYFEFVVSPAEGLFQGVLPAPADAAAEVLGIAELPVLTWRVNCSTGSFDYHLLSGSLMLLGLDHVVWRLQMEGVDASPEFVTLSLLRIHMTHDMAFTRESIDGKASFLTPGLLKAIDGYFAVPDSPDEVPLINGDPFTDSQEYPSSFVLGAARMESWQAIVPVVFQDFDRQKRVEMVLHREGSGWLVDDLRFSEGPTLRELLSEEVTRQGSVDPTRRPSRAAAE